jgi:hypothetical protein
MAYSQKACPVTTLSTTNPTYTCRKLKRLFGTKMLATNCLSHGKAGVSFLWIIQMKNISDAFPYASAVHDIPSEFSLLHII